MASQMTAFWDGAGAVWASGALTGKVGAVLPSTATQHGGQETTLFAGITTSCTRHGDRGLPYSFQGQSTSTRSPAALPTAQPPSRAGQGQRQPSQKRARGRPLSGARRPDGAKLKA
jgi:NAD(P)H dehydrogenase (quinone)